MSDNIKAFRESLNLPENKDKKVKYLTNQQKYNKKYIKKQLENPATAKQFRDKRNEQLRQCRIRKKQAKKRTAEIDGFANKSAKSRALTKADLGLPVPLNQKLTILNELNLRYAGKSELPKEKKQLNRNEIKETEVLVMNFLCSDIVSRQLPGIKDYKIVKVGGLKQKIQKRSMTMSMKEAYEEFQKEFADRKICFSKFAKMRPEHVGLFSQSKQWSCLCIYCANLEFLLSGLLPFLTKSITLKDLMIKLSCSLDDYKCASGACHECINVIDLLKTLLKPDILNDQLDYQQWETVNRAVQKVTHSVIVNDALTALDDKMHKFKLHYYLIKTQLSFFRVIKEKLTDNDVCLIVDYAENYNCRSQNEVSSAYFGRRQISLFTAVAYVGQEDPINFCLANDCIAHNKEQIWYYSKFIINFLQCFFSNIKNVHVFSDGACSQFKNRFNMSNLLYADEDFNVDLKWHFFPTAHGKTSADGVGAIVKRGVYSRVLSGKWEVNCAEQFVECANSFKNCINTFEIKQNDIDREAIDLMQRYKNINSIKGIRDLHFFEKSSTYGNIVTAKTSKKDNINDVKLIKK